MYTTNQEEQDYRDNSQVNFQFSSDDRKEDEKRKENGLEDEELEEGGGWGDVVPAGGDAPSASGSAV